MVTINLTNGLTITASDIETAFYLADLMDGEPVAEVEVLDVAEEDQRPLVELAD